MGGLLPSLFNRGMAAFAPQAAVRRATQLDSCQPTFNQLLSEGQRRIWPSILGACRKVGSSTYCLFALTAPTISHQFVIYRRRGTSLRLSFVSQAFVFVSRHARRDARLTDPLTGQRPTLASSRSSCFLRAGALTASGRQPDRFKSHCQLSFQYQRQDHGLEHHHFRPIGVEAESCSIPTLRNRGVIGGAGVAERQAGSAVVLKRKE